MAVPNPKDPLATIFLVTIVTIVSLFAVVNSPTAMKPGLFALTAAILCSIMLWPLPIIRRALSIELRTRDITITLILTCGLEMSALDGTKSLDPEKALWSFILCCAFSYIGLVYLEPLVYRFLGGKTELDFTEGPFGLPKESFSKEAERIKLLAVAITVSMDQPEIDTGQFLIALSSTKNAKVYHLLSSLGANDTVLSKMLKTELGVKEKKKALIRFHREMPPLSAQAHDLAKKAVEWSNKLESGPVKGEHLLLALLDLDDSIGARLLRSLNINEDILRERLIQSVKGVCAY